MSALSGKTIMAPHADGEQVDRTDRPALSVRVPRRGVLASRSSVPWRGQTTVRQVGLPLTTPVLGPPGPVESVIEAHPYLCSVCGGSSFVRAEDAKSYIKCPFCLTVSTTNISKSRKSAVIWFACGILCLIVVPILIAVELLYSSGTAVVLFPVGTGIMALKRSWDYQKVPKSDIHVHSVLYHPSLQECLEAKA